MVEVDEQWLLNAINEKIGSGEFQSSIGPYAEVKKSRNSDENRRYGRYYLWDHSVDHIMAADVCLERLAFIAGLTNESVRSSDAA